MRIASSIFLGTLFYTKGDYLMIGSIHECVKKTWTHLYNEFVRKYEKLFESLMIK